MRWRSWTYATIVTSIGFAATPANAQGFSAFSAGSWTGEAVFYDASFHHCAMHARSGEWQVGLLMNSQGWVTVGLKHKRLKFTKGATIRGAIAVDGSEQVTHPFEAYRRTYVVARLRNHPLVQKLRQASRIRVAVGEVAHDFPVSRTQQAFTQLAACASKRGRK